MDRHVWTPGGVPHSGVPPLWPILSGRILGRERGPTDRPHGRTRNTHTSQPRLTTRKPCTQFVCELQAALQHKRGDPRVPDAALPQTQEARKASGRCCLLGGRCLLFAPCNLLLATCCLLLAACCLPLAACCWLLAACLLAAWWLLLDACWLLLADRCLLPAPFSWLLAACCCLPDGGCTLLAAFSLLCDTCFLLFAACSRGLLGSPGLSTT